MVAHLPICRRPPWFRFPALWGREDREVHLLRAVQRRGSRSLCSVPVTHMRNQAGGREGGQNRSNGLVIKRRGGA